MVDPHDDPIELVPSRHEAWREAFERERDRVLDALGAAGPSDAVERVAHVGSTAVPDLAAKDTVDLDVVVTDDAVAETSRALLAELGGDRAKNSEEWHPVFREHDGRRFNDHVFAASSDKWKVSVATRDVLRARPGLRDEYEALKRDLAADHDDLEAYSIGKTEFVARLLREAHDADDLSFDFAVPAMP